MKNIILILLLFSSVNLFAQYDHSIKIDPVMDKDSVYIMLTEDAPIKYRQGKGKWVNLESFKETTLRPEDTHWFNTNLSSNGNHTHNAGNDLYNVNNIGGWFLRAGSAVVNESVYAMDSTAVSIFAPNITLSQGLAVNPKIHLNGAGDHIVFTSSDGDYIFDNVPTFADEAAAGAGGLTTGRIYKTAAGVLMIKL